LNGFIDEIIIDISSGKGGDGCVSFRREKYVERGGPDGGDGGRGGAIIFEVKNNLHTLSHISRKKYKAKSGMQGSSAKKKGIDGEDLVIPVPPGTRIIDFETKQVLAVLNKVDEQFSPIRGGNGGKGNWHYRSSANQTPQYAQKGQENKEMKLILELALIADIGLVGFPNAGKSSFMRHLTNSTTKVASYAFTTKIPHLGIYNLNYRPIILADIPGILEGASQGFGLGLKFLRHIEKTQGLLFLIDLSQDNYLEAFDLLLKELETYSSKLANKKRIILGTKLDLDNTQECLENLKEKYPQENIHGISTFSLEGIADISDLFINIIEN